MFDLFILMMQIIFFILTCFIVLGIIIAVIILPYSLILKKDFKEAYHKALVITINWIISLFNTQTIDNSNICKINDRRWIEPLIKALNDNECHCIERNTYILSQVAHYQIQLLDKMKEKELDLSYLEQLIQAVYYTDVLPLYQNPSEYITKENISVFITRQDLVFWVYIGHTQVAYKKLNEYREQEKQRQLETLNNMCKEMIE